MKILLLINRLWIFSGDFLFRFWICMTVQYKFMQLSWKLYCSYVQMYSPPFFSWSGHVFMYRFILLRVYTVWWWEFIKNENDGIDVENAISITLYSYQKCIRRRIQKRFDNITITTSWINISLTIPRNIYYCFILLYTTYSIRV